jgi:hypothetical protein
MSEVTIVTNSVPRDILDGWDVPADVRADFDYIDWDAVDEGSDSVSFFRYKGQWYDLGDVPARSPHVPTDEPDPFEGWDGLASDSFFSGILVRYAGEDSDQIIVGRFYS